MLPVSKSFQVNCPGSKTIPRLRVIETVAAQLRHGRRSVGILTRRPVDLVSRQQASIEDTRHVDGGASGGDERAGAGEEVRSDVYLVAPRTFGELDFGDFAALRTGLLLERGHVVGSEGTFWCG